MTSSPSFAKNSFNAINLPPSFGKKLSTDIEELESLIREKVPFSNETTDCQGNRSRLWVLKNGMFFGIVVHSDGKISFIPSNKIINFCTNSPLSSENLKRLEGLQIDLAYISEQKKLIVLPHLRAAGKDDPLAQVAAKSLNPKPPASWVPPSFEDTPERWGHIFRKKGKVTHFSKNTPENRAYILGAVSDPANRKAVNKFGKEMYFKVMPDGYLSWAHVENGVITNGGRSSPWYKWVEDPNEHAGGRTQPRSIYTRDKFTFQELVLAECITKIYNKNFPKNNPPKNPPNPPKNPPPNPQKESFKDRVQANRLVGSYNSCHPDHPMEEGGSSGGHIGGVGNEIGIILGLFDDLSGRMESEHTFFLPVLDKLSLNQEEVQRMLHELALGIFVHDTVPFFSLHFNGDTNMYPVIHPVYQNTFVGHVISMLDYHMKGFLNGGFFPAAFVQEWNQNPDMSEEALQEQIIDVREYCHEHLGPSYRYLSVRELTEALELKEALEPVVRSVEEHPILKDYSGFRSSFRIIAHQKSIKKMEDLFVLDGGFDVRYTITPDPDYESELSRYRQLTGEDPPSYRRLEKAYDAMSEQIKRIMPQVPEFKKFFEALNIINFFCYYFNTLKKANKFPILSHRVFKDTDGCPPLFPHLPLRAFYHEKFELKLAEFFNTFQAKIDPVDFFGSSFAFLLVDEEKKHLINRFLVTNNGKEEAIQHMAEELQKYVFQKTKYPLAKKQKEIDFYKENASSFLEKFKKIYVKAKEEQLPELNASIKEWESKYNHFSSCASIYIANENDRRENGLRHRYNRENNVRISESNLDMLKAKRSELLKYPLSLLNSETKIDLPIESMDSTLHLYGEHKLEEEKQLQKRIVGGCGVELGHKPMSVDPVAYPLLDRNFGQLSHLFNEEILEVAHEGTNGVLFKLCFADFPLVEEEEKQAALGYLSPPKIPMSDAMVDVFHAIATSDEELFEETAEQITSWNFQDGHGMSPLHYAASVANTRMLDHVIGKGAIHLRDSQGHTALHFAAQSGNLEGVKLLLSKAPGLIDIEATGGATALYVAVQHGKLQVVEALLAKGASPNCRTAQGMNALMCAIYRGFGRIAFELLDHEKIDLNHVLDDKTTALHLAVECKKIMFPVIEKLIGKGIDVNQARWDGHTALHLATRRGHVVHVRCLINAPGVNLNARLKSGKTALHLAAEQDHDQIVELLLKNKADPLLFGWDRETTLITAIRNGSMYSALCLLRFTKNQTVTIDEKQIPFENVKDQRGQTALEIAAKLRLWDAWSGLFNPSQDDPKNTALQPMEYLLLICHPGVDLDVIEIFRKKHQLNQPEQLMQVLETAAKNGHTILVSHLYSKLKVESFRDANGWTVHHYMAKFDHINFFQDVFSRSELPSSQEIEEWATVAARYGSMRSLKILLDVLSQRKLLPAAGKKPLLEAVQAGHLKTADLIIHKILDANIPLEASGKRAAHLAVINNDAEMVQLLIERGAKFNLADSKNLTALHYAILYNHEELLISLLAPSKEIEIPADLLHFAAAKASPKMLDLLLKRISNINALDPIKRETALMSAVRANRLTNVSLLCLHGASLHISNSKGETPLLLAAKQYGSLLQLLLSYNPPYQVTNQGENALHLAAMHGQDGNVQFLLKHNFDASIPDKAQKTPLMHAQEKEFFDICDILQGKSAQLEKAKETIVSSLMNREQDSFFEALKGLPINKPMIFVVPHAGKVSSSILHLIYGLIPDRKKEVLDKFVQEYQPDIHSITEQGHSLLHIAGIKDQEPPFKKMHVLAPDRKGITPLHLFAQSDSLVRFKKAIFSGIDQDRITTSFDIEDEEMQTPLFYAIQKNRLDIASFLLEKGANPNHRSKKLMTPLGIAIEKNSLPIVRALMEKGASIEVRMGVDGEFPLHLAVRKGFDEIVKHLVENTTNMFQKDRQGKEPIHVAAIEGNRNMVRFLYACGASLLGIDHQGNGLAYFAAQSQCPELLDFLKEHNVSFDSPADGNPQPEKAPLHMAVRKGNFPMIAQFSRYGADFEARDSKGDSALYYATISKNTEILEFFSQSPLMDEEQQVRTSLVAAIRLDSVPQLRILQKELNSIDQPLDISQGLTLLHVACKLGANRVVHHLLKEGADPLLKMYDGTSAFDLAVLHNHVEIADKISTYATIDPNQKLSSGKTYLHLAAAAGSKSMIALLYLQEADIDSLDAEGCTPLLIAAHKGHLSTIKLLLALGAITTTQSLKGQTIYDMIEDEETRAVVARYEKISAFCQDLGEGKLHAAVRLGDSDALMILAKRNDTHQKNKEGREPLHVAATQKNLSILRRLLELEIAPDLEIRDHQGKTPLFIAATEAKDPQLVQFLLSLGADPQVETNKGVSLLEAVQRDEQSAAIFKLLTTERHDYSCK